MQSGASGALFIVSSGRVEYERTDVPVCARFAPGTIVAGVSGIGDPADSRVRALVPSVLLRLRVEDLFDVMEDHFDLVRSMLAHGSSERERLMAVRAAREKAASTSS
jgi:CRP-like cAMP-binding protein